MPEPLLVATWSFSTRAAEAAWAGLANRGRALDAVVDACSVAEEDPTVDSVGYGGLPDAEGHVSLDGCVMLAPGLAGSVACLRTHRHPVRVARMVMERTRHLMIVGDAADRFADDCGELREEVLAPEAKEAWRSWMERSSGDVDAAREAAERRGVLDAARTAGGPGPDEHGAGGTGRAGPIGPTGALRPVDLGAGGRLFTHDAKERRWHGHDTIGVLARDHAGVLAGACSTSGTPFKRPGRVGDSPIIGHGLYVDPGVGAATATGTGELISAVCGSFLVVESMRAGRSAEESIRAALRRVDESLRIEPHHQVAFVAMRDDGTWAAGALRKGFLAVSRDAQGVRVHEPAVVLRDD